MRRFNLRHRYSRPVQEPASRQLERWFSEPATVVSRFVAIQRAERAPTREHVYDYATPLFETAGASAENNRLVTDWMIDGAI